MSARATRARTRQLTALSQVLAFSVGPAADAAGDQQGGAPASGGPDVEQTTTVREAEQPQRIQTDAAPGVPTASSTTVGGDGADGARSGGSSSRTSRPGDEHDEPGAGVEETLKPRDEAAVALKAAVQERERQLAAYQQRLAALDDAKRCAAGCLS